MSGPYCRDCKYFYRHVFDQKRGECLDTSKIIFAGKGNRVNDNPDVHETNECSNFKEKE